MNANTVDCRRRVRRLLPALCIALVASASLAQEWEVPRHVVAAGGGSSSGGTYTVSGSIGQVDAEPLHPASGGRFALAGGFWFAAAGGNSPGAGCGTDAACVFRDGFETP